MKKIETVYKLIKGLNSKEKKAFRNARGVTAKGKSYQELYDFLSKLAVFDEEKINQKFPEKAQLAANIGYLYEKIIESFRITQQEGALINLIRSIEEYKILYAKGFNKFGSKIAWQAYQTAMKYEYWYHAKEIIIEIDARSYIEPKELRKALEEIIDLEKNHLHYFMEYYSPILALSEKSFPLRAQEDINKMHLLIKSDYLQNPELALSARAKMLRCSALIHAYSAINDTENTISTTKEAINLFEENPILKAEYWRANLIFKGNLLQSLFDYEKATEAEVEKLALELESEISIRGNCNDLYPFIMGTVPVFFLTKTNNRQKAIIWKDKMEKVFFQIKNEIGPIEVQIYHTNRIMLNYYLADFQKALKHALEIRKIGINTRDDIYAWAKIWYLIINFELKNWRHLASESWANYYTISRNHPNAKVEKVCTLFFKKVAKHKENNDTENVLKTFEKLHDELKNLENIESEALFLEELEIFPWIEKQMHTLSS